MKFPYLKIPLFAIPERQFIFKPVIPLKLGNKQNPSKTVSLHGLIDSGADATILSAEYGEAIGLEVKKGKTGKFSGIGEGRITVYFHEVILEVILNVGGYQWVAEVGFTYNEGVVAILGQVGFFEKFRVAFDYPKKTIEITPKQD